MSQNNGKHLDTLDLACLPAADPLRQQHAATLTGAAREDFEREAQLSDQLRASLPDVAVPADLQARLLGIPWTIQPAAAAPAAGAPTAPIASAAPSAGISRVFGRVGLFRRPAFASVAAGVIILAGIAALYFLVLREPPKPVPLDAAQTAKLTTLALAQQQAPLEITSSDVTAVQQRLASHSLDFPVLMLQPTTGTLEGGGVCDFGGTRAAFTRWNVSGQRYTLYELNGKNLNIPASFYPKTEFPNDPAKAGGHQQVFLFPGKGGACCWALVMDNESSPNVFSQYGAAY